MKTGRPVAGEYPAFYENYISLVKGDDLLSLFLTEHYDTIDLITSVDLETQHFRYAEGKWNMKEIIQHVMDAERVFAYRALCFARGEKASLPGFDENQYVQHSMATGRDMNDIAREFSVLRASTIELFKSLHPETYQMKGIANNKEITVRSLMYITLGHELHHRKIIEERYLPK